MNFRHHIGLATAALAAGQAAAAPPRRIVSMNMCADQLVIALADRGQIAGLTEWSRDPILSYYADRARHLPVTKRSAEEVLMLRPDVVIGTPSRARAALAPLRVRGVNMVDMPQSDGETGIADAIRTVAAAVGHPARGEAMIARMTADLARTGRPGRGRVAAYYQRQGYLTGTGTLVDAMMQRVGLVNLAAKIDAPSLSRLSLEQMAVARPDFLITDGGARRTDLGTKMIGHPLLARVIAPGHRLAIPQAYTVCGGPGYAKAVALLAAQVEAADAVRR